MPSKVLFVCTGNICRSPLAEYLARSVHGDDDVTFESAGTHAVAGLPATMEMVSVGTELGVDLRGHVSRSITEVDRPDLILCMERHHVETASRVHPDLPRDAIRLLDTVSIADPYGENLATYRICANQISAAIESLQF